MKKFTLVVILIFIFLSLAGEFKSQRKEVLSRTFITANMGLIRKFEDKVHVILDVNYFYQRNRTVYSLQFCNGSTLGLYEMPYNKGSVLIHREFNALYNFNLVNNTESNNLLLVGAGLGLIYQRVRDERISYEKWSKESEYMPSLPINFSFIHLGKRGGGTSLNAYYRVYKKENLLGFSIGLTFGGAHEE